MSLLVSVGNVNKKKVTSFRPKTPSRRAFLAEMMLLSFSVDVLEDILLFAIFLGRETHQRPVISRNISVLDDFGEVGAAVPADDDSTSTFEVTEEPIITVRNLHATCTIFRYHTPCTM